MTESGAYGDSIAQRFRLDRAHSSQLVRLDDEIPVAITRLQSDAAGLARSLPIPTERALIVVLLLQPLPDHELWFGQTSIPVEPWPTGAVSVVDLEEDPSARVGGNSDVLQFYLPRESLDVLASHNDVRPIRNLDITDGMIDPIIHRLGNLTLQALQNPNQANLLFLSGLMTALYAHLSKEYGGIRVEYPSKNSGLTQAQLFRAKEMISESLHGNLSLSAIASECQVPSAYFARAFKKATGLAPHKWLLNRRVETAKKLLATGRLDGPHVAETCGFADEDHMIRVFSTVVGVSPSEWQRNIGSASNKQK